MITPRKLSALSEDQLQKLIALFGALIACQVIYIQHGWVNDDSILYFEVARLFSLGEWKQGIALYNWPLYPAIIAFFHKVTGTNIQLVAQALNAILFTLATYSFTSIIRLAGGSKLTMLCGALLLFSTPYIVGDVLPMLLRDQGFWAFFLLSIQYFIQFYRSGALSHALLWQLFAIVSVLFRVEAVTFLVLLPLVLLTKKNVPRIKNWTYANSLSLLAFTLVATTLLFNPNLTLNSFGRLHELFSVLLLSYSNITQAFVAKAHTMNEQILGGYLDGYGMMGVIITMITILLSKCLLSPGWMASIVLIGNWKNGIKDITPDALKIIYWVIAIATLNAAVILTSNFILSGRYIVSLAFIMLVLAAFSLAQIYRTSQTRWQNRLLILTLAMLSFSLINNMFPKNSEYNYEQHAVNWIKKHNTSNDPVFYMSPSTRFYAGEPYAGRGYDEWAYTMDAIADGSIQQYKYLAIELKNHQPEKEKQLFNGLNNYQLAKEVMGFRSKKKVMIFVKKE